jgi:CHAT domain-containing protein
VLWSKSDQKITVSEGEEMAMGMDLRSVGLVMGLWLAVPLGLPGLAQVPLVVPDRKVEAVGEALREANRLYQQGESQLNQGQLPAALESLQKALVIYRGIPDRKQEGHTLRLIGGVYFNQQNYPKMIEFQQQALDIAREIQDSDLEARALHNIGLAYASLKQPDKAVDYYQQSLVVSRRSQNFKMIAITVGNLSVLYSNAEDYTKSRLVLQDALSRVPESMDKSRLLLSLGNTYLMEAIGDPETLTMERIQKERLSPSLLYAQAIAAYQQALAAMQTAPDPLLKGDILFQMSSAYVKTGEYVRSIEGLKEAVALFKQMSNRPKQLANLVSLMNAYAHLGASLKNIKDYSKALNTLEQEIALAPEALELAKILNQPAEEKDILYYQTVAHSTAARIYLELQDLPKAKEQAELAWTLAKQSGKPKAEQNALTALGGYYNAVGDNVKELEVNQRALELDRLNSNPYEESQSLTSLAGSYSSLGNAEKALQLLREADTKAATITLKNLPAYATPEFIIRLKRDIAMNFAVIYGHNGDYTQELAFAQQALGFSRQMSDRKEEFTFLRWVANAHSSREDYLSAQQMIQQARALAKTLNNPKLEIEALIDLSDIAADQRSPQNAVEYAQQALTLVQEHKPKQSIHYDWVDLEFRVLNALSNAYKSQGNYSKALELLQQGVKVSEQAADSSIKQGAMHILGAFYLSLGDYTNATAQSQKVLTLAQKQQNPIYQQGTLSFLSQVAFAQQKPQQAIQFAQQGLAISRQMQYLNGELSNMQALSRGYGELGDDAKAMAMAQATLDLARKTGNIGYERSALETLGNLHRRFGRWDQALASYEAVLASGGKYATTYAGLAQVYAHRRQSTVAIALYKQAINNFETHRRHLRGLSTDLQQAYLQSTVDFGGVKNADIYRQLADLLISQGRIGEAQQVLELLKIQELNDFTKGTRTADQLSDIAINDVEQNIIKQHGTLIAFGQTLQQCLDTNCAQKAQLLQQRTVLVEQYNQAVQQIEAQFRTSSAQDLEYLKPNSEFSTTAQNIIDKQREKGIGTALLYPLVLDKKLWIVLVTEGGVLKRYEVAVSQAELSATVVALQQQLRSPYSDLKQLQATSKKLYDWIIPKALETELNATDKTGKRKVQHLVFALDRVTRYIPMSALFNGQQYLIENYAISTITAASRTDWAQGIPSNSQPVSALALGVSAATGKFAALPNVPNELDAIVKKGPADRHGSYSGAELLNGAFTFESLSNNLAGHQLLHIATHGQFVPGRANDSYLLLGNGKSLAIPQINTLQELRKVDLVVLSACETALGGTGTDGIEINGISSYFLSKGAKAVMASLWLVNDTSTSLLMQQFYQNLATGTMTKAEAIRQSQLQLLQGKLTAKDAPTRSDVEIRVTDTRRTVQSQNYSHPYYWAPFILIGNGL